MSNELDLVQLYKTALRIRLIESSIANRYSEGKMRCPVHLSIGQEMPSALFKQVVHSGDTAVSTHRAHAHYLAMGGNLSRLIAEIYGKVTGCSKGMGGSMHLIDLERGFLGSSAIVGNSIPIGVGVGYGMQLSGGNKVSFIFLGDGAVEEGAFYESVNFAVVHKLPVVFILENNLYSVYTNLSARQPRHRSLAQLASTIGLYSETADDSEFQDTFAKLKKLTRYSREGYGPSLIEIRTYRTLEHCGPEDDDHLGYRSEDEIIRLKKVDLVGNLECLISISPFEKSEIISEIMLEIDEAFTFAEISPFPIYEEVIGGVYSN